MRSSVACNGSGFSGSPCIERTGQSRRRGSQVLSTTFRPGGPPLRTVHSRHGQSHKPSPAAVPAAHPAHPVRIIGGTLKGRRFSPPRHFKGRPTTDFGREGLFNLLRSRIDLEGVEALDLFAGSGAVSYELASRGALRSPPLSRMQELVGTSSSRPVTSAWMPFASSGPTPLLFCPAR